ncbi:CHAD domain-containing protein [bacterium]|nr:CHAD domain-containing protein [bacterium]
MAMMTESDPGFRNALLRLISRRRRRAERHVADAARDLERSVHELRRMCKELRALWRMIRPAVGEDLYSRENLRLRDAARAMAGARDAVVLLDTLERMRTRRRSRRGRGQWREAGEAFKAHLSDTLGDALKPVTLESVKPALYGALDAFRTTHEAIDALPAETDLAWQPGVGRVYKQGRKRMKQAYQTGGDIDFHNWRKSTKYLFFQLRLLERMKQARSGKRVKALNKLEKTLGRDHDLVMLREKLAGLAAGDHAPGAAVFEDLSRYSARLRKLSAKPGKKLFSQKPADFIGSIEKRRRNPPETQAQPEPEAAKN